MGSASLILPATTGTAIQRNQKAVREETLYTRNTYIVNKRLRIQCKKSGTMVVYIYIHIYIYIYIEIAYTHIDYVNTYTYILLYIYIYTYVYVYYAICVRCLLSIIQFTNIILTYQISYK